MRPVVDIIADVVTAMKPAQTFTLTGTGSPYTLSGLAHPELLYVGMRVKITGTNFTATGYYLIASITGTTCTVTGATVTYLVPPTTWTGSFTPVLNFHHGHLLEIKNIFQQATQKATLKLEQFPAIVCVQDFPEKTDRKKHERIATVRILILTDSKQQYTASERYTNTFEPKLYPLEDLFLKKLESSKEIGGYEQDFTRYDRLFWGRATGEGTASNIFNDFIDAIELENLNLKILNTC
jgi:hypothetical protein